MMTNHSKTIQLRSGGTVTASGTFDYLTLEPADRELVESIADLLARYEAGMTPEAGAVEGFVVREKAIANTKRLIEETDALIAKGEQLLAGDEEHWASMSVNIRSLKKLRGQLAADLAEWEAGAVEA